MGSHGHLELILKDGSLKKAEVFFDGPTYVVNVLQELAILAGRENKSITYLNLQRWFKDVVKMTGSDMPTKYESPSADYCRIDQQEGKIDVDSFFVYDGDELGKGNRRLKIDLENPHNMYGFDYDPKSLKAALKILGHRDAVFWKDKPEEDFYSGRIDVSIPFKVRAGELLSVKSVGGSPVLFEFDGKNFRERKYND